MSFDGYALPRHLTWPSPQMSFLFPSNREYLHSLVTERRMRRAYASTICKQWNATIRDAFGHDAAGPLIMRGFTQPPSTYERLEGDEWEMIRDAILNAPAGQQNGLQRVRGRFRSEYERRLFYTFWELQRVTGCRYASAVSVRACDLDFERRRVRFLHMKIEDKEDGWSYLDSRSCRVLAEWVELQKTRPGWNGPETPIFRNAQGKIISLRFVNSSLKKAAVRAGIRKPLSSHKVRGAQITRLATETDVKVAARQAHITEAVLLKHYYRPTERQFERAMSEMFGDLTEPANPLDRALRPRHRDSAPELN